MNLEMYQVDAFTEVMFKGNPAAVIVTEEELPVELMQSIANENNLAETAFVFGPADALAIKWFTPVREVALCGHATLAAAHVFYEHLGCAAPELAFYSRSGVLKVKKLDDVLWLDFPADQYESAQEISVVMESALGVSVESINRGRDDLLVCLASETQLFDMTPHIEQLGKFECRGVIVTAPGDEVDFVSRFFAPRYGISEDPVTGSAHTTLTPYWADRLGKLELSARQLSARGGDLQCRLEGDRVHIGGKALTYMKAELSL